MNAIKSAVSFAVILLATNGPSSAAPADGGVEVRGNVVVSDLPPEAHRITVPMFPTDNTACKDAGFSVDLRNGRVEVTFRDTFPKARYDRAGITLSYGSAECRLDVTIKPSGKTIEAAEPR